MGKEEDNKESSYADVEFKTMAEMDKDRKPWTGGSVFGKCICGGATDKIRFFGTSGTMLYCCGDICYYKIDELYFKKGD